ncbi:MAG: FMN-binding protein [bacterium]
MKEKIKMVIFVVILGTVCTFSLVAINGYTAPIVEKNKEIKIKKSLLEAYGISYEKGNKENIEKIFMENVTVSGNEGKKIYINKDKETAFEFAGSGLWGPITGVISFMPDLETIKNIVIIHQEETPGLGGRIGEKAYLDKFKDKKFLPDIKIVPPGKAQKENEIDGITGATMTVKAFEKLVNKQVEMYRNSLKSKKN